MSVLPPSEPKGPGRKLIAAAAALAVVAVILLVFRGAELRSLLGRAVVLINRGIDYIASFGPWAFFTAMAILPAVGAPALAFTLTAGRAFGAQMGMAGVIAAGSAAMIVNYAITYWVGRFLLREPLSRLFARLGYRLPEVPEGDMTDLVVILRVTPGVPLCVQNYLCGLADVPATRYFVVSCILGLPNGAAFILFGGALSSGKGSTIMKALMLIIALAAATHVLRRHLAQRKALA